MKLLKSWISLIVLFLLLLMKDLALPPLEALSRNCIPIIGEAGGNATFSQNLFNCLTYDTQNKNNLLKAIKKLYGNDELANF